MKKRQITALLLALTLGLTVCACGKDTTDDKGTDTSVDTSATDDGKPKLSVPAADYDETITFLSVEDTYPGNFRLNCDDTKGDALNEAGYNRAVAVSEHLGVDFDFYTAANSNVFEALNISVMSGDGAYDFVLPHCQNGIASLVSGGLLLPWEELDYVDFTNPWWNKNMQDSISVADKTFFAAGDITMTWQGLGAIIFNKEYLETYKIEEDLYEIAYNGEWTLDKMKSLISGIGDDISGDNKMDRRDQYGFLTSAAGAGATVQIAAGIPFTEKDEDGVPVLAMGGEKMINLVEKYYSILYSPDTYIAESTSNANFPSSIQHDILFEGRSFLTSYDLGGLYMHLRDLDFEFGILPYPKFDENQEEYYSACAAGIIGVPIDADTEIVGAVAETLAYYSYQYVRPAFFDIVLQNKALRDEDSYNMLTIMHEGKYYDFAYNFVPKACYMLDDVVVKNKSTDFSSYYASKEDALNIEMRDIYDAVIANFE